MSSLRGTMRVMLVLAALVIGMGGVFAGSVDYLSNQSAKYIMTFSRNASTDASADIVAFNPAGTALMPQGLYIDISNQTLFKPYSTESKTNLSTAANSAPVNMADKDSTLEQNKPTYFLPNAYVAYNLGQVGPGKLAIYGQTGIIAGGGSLKWDDGTAGTTFALSAIGVSTAAGLLGAGSPTLGDIASQSFEASSIYYGIAVGSSYSINDMISGSLGGRYVIATRSLKLDAEYTSGTNVSGEYTYEAKGFTPILGVAIKPLKELTFAARYEFETKLEFKYKEEGLSTSGGNAFQNGALLNGAKSVLSRAGIADGNKFNYNLPQIISLGGEFTIIPALSVMSSANFYLLKYTDMGKVYDSSKAVGTNEVGDLNDYFGIGYELSVGATYLVLPELKIGAGCMYTESGAKDSYFNNQYTKLVASGNPPLDSISISCGATYAINKNFEITLSALWTHYIPFDYSYAVQGTTAGAITDVSGTYKKDVYDIGLGASFKM
jgi:long-chain fatty acid transport protein